MAIISRKRFFELAGAGVAFALGCGDDDSTGTGTTTTTTSGDGGGTTTTSTTTSGTGGDASGGGGANAGGSGTGGAGGGGAACTAMITAAISANHGHSLEIPLADIEAGVDMTYSAQGTAMHCHEVTLTAADFATLKAGGSVTKHSCNGGDHEYVISCAPGAPQPGTPDCSQDPNFGACG